MYIPKNKIKTGLTTNGKELLDEKGNDYIGSYYELSTGKIFSGKFPGDGENKILFKVGEITPPSTNPPLKPPISLKTSSVPLLYPTDQDYKNTFFIRYFSKKRNEYLFKELTKNEYDSLNQPSNTNFSYYKPFTLKWMLVGEEQTVTNFNYYSIIKTEESENVYGLNQFLNMNYLQYYKFLPKENLYTNGNELMTPDGKEYIGPYHIDPDKGYMIGAVHTNTSRNVLFPMNSNMTKPKM